jgi:ectoine hydroxylase-related dioxygenase (phytanoyl-CoA dioxygenase family)
MEIIPRFVSGHFTKQDFLSAIEQQGFAVVENVLSTDFCEQMIPGLEAAIETEALFHGTREHKDYGMLLACPVYGGHFLKLVDNETVMKPFDWILGDTSIIYVYTSSSMPPNQTNYSARIHVDRPHFIPGYTEALGCLVMLNDFTEDNGATWVLPASHHQVEAPDEDSFYKNAIRITAPRGSVFYFHLRLWHAGGRNTTHQWRHSVGIGMVRSYLKQRIDLPRALAYSKTDLSGISDFGLQKLGFFSQPPTSLAEFHAPIEKRSYRQRSEWEPEKDKK